MQCHARSHIKWQHLTTESVFPSQSGRWRSRLALPGRQSGQRRTQPPCIAKAAASDMRLHAPDPTAPPSAAASLLPCTAGGLYRCRTYHAPPLAPMMIQQNAPMCRNIYSQSWSDCTANAVCRSRSCCSEAGMIANQPSSKLASNLLFGRIAHRQWATVERGRAFY